MRLPDRLWQWIGLWFIGLREGCKSAKFWLCLIIIGSTLFLARMGVLHEMAIGTIFTVIGTIYCSARALTDCFQPPLPPGLPLPPPPPEVP